MDGDSFSSSVVEALLADEIFADAKYEKLARLVPHLSMVEFAPGEAIFRAGEAAQHLFLVIAGFVEIIRGDAPPVMAETRRIGDEAATDLREYISSAVALSAVQAVAIPRGALAEAIKQPPELKARFYYSTIHGPDRAEGQSPAKAKDKRIGALEVAGWALTTLVPAAILALGGELLGLSGERLMFMAVLSAVICMWAFALIDDYIPVLFALLASVVLGLAPTSVVLGGFSSDGFLMAMSILGLGTVMSVSGLSYRLLLYALRAAPDRPFWHNIVLVIIGFVLTPTIPSANGRVGLMLPSLVELIEELKIKKGSIQATRLTLGMFTGVTLLSGVFLTSKSVNFVVFALLPPQGQDAFQWSSWAMAASVAGATMLAGYLLVDQVVARLGGRPASLPRELLTTQIGLLGEIKQREWAAVLGVAILIVGVATTSLHRIAPPWLGLAVLYGLLVMGFLRKSEFREHIDWPFLVYLAGSAGIIATFNFLGLDRWVTGQIGWVGTYMREDFALFLAVLAVLTFVVRLMVPISATIVLFAAVLMPVAEANGVNPWIVGFAVLTLGEMWFLPYQCSYYGQLRAGTAKANLYDERQFLVINLAMNALRLAGLYASLPFWKMLGLL